MSFAINVHKLFWLDVAKIRNHYESVSEYIADKFESAFESAYENVQQSPEAYFNLSKN